MEPLTALAAKAASPLAKPAMSLLFATTLGLRTARRAIADAEAAGNRVNLKRLRFVLRGGAVKRALRTGTEADRADAVLELSTVEIRRSDGKTDTDGEYLFVVVQRARARVGRPNDAVIAMADAVAHQQSGGGLAARPTPVVSPVMRARADELRHSYGALVDSILVAITAAGSRPDLLQDWAFNRPAWIGSEAEIIGWLAELALDAGSRRAARRFVDDALELGASPRAYWKVIQISTWSEAEQAQGVEYVSDVADHPLIRAIIQANSRESRRTSLAEWTPSTSTERSMKVTLDLELGFELEELDDVIARGTQAFREEGLPAAGVVAVKALLRRTYSGGFRLHSNDASDARELALAIRGALRSWGSDSTPPVPHAMNASMLLVDLDRAWSLSQVEPDGEATRAEAEAPRIFDMATILLAERGRIDEAIARLGKTASAATSTEVRAIEAEYLGEPERANMLWSESIKATSDWQQKAATTLRLAIRGVRDPFIEVLRTSGNDAAAADIALIADVANEVPGATGRARAASRENSVVAHALIGYFERVERTAELIPLLEEVAERWGDADLWLRAARAHGREGNLQLAVDRARRALTTGGDAWGDKAAAHIVIVEASFQAEDWSTADIEARALLSLRPDSESSQWAYVLSVFFAGREDEAYQRWCAFNPHPAPRTANETGAWLSFFRRHGAEVGTVDDVIAAIRRHPVNEDVRRVGILSLIQVPEEAVNDPYNLGELIEQFRTDFPDSTAFQLVSFDGEDAESILNALDALQNHDVDYTPLEDGLRNGTLPIGAVAQLVGRSYAEVLVTRDRSARFAGELAPVDTGQVGELLGSPISIDSSALLTLSDLPADVASELRATFSRVSATSGQLLDANAGREALRHSTGGHFFPTTASSPRRFESPDPDSEARHRDRVERLVAQFSFVDRAPHRSVSAETKDTLGSLDGPWVVAIDYAKANGLPLWSDDTAQRRIASMVGVRSIGTPELLASLREHPTALDVDVVEAELIHNFVVGIAFRSPVWRAALEFDGFRVGGLALAIRHGGATDLETKVALGIEAMGHSTADPSQLENWARVLWELVVESGGPDGPGDDNAAKLARDVIRNPWCDQSTFPFIVHGWKAAVPSRFERSFTHAIRSIYRPAAQQLGWEVAAQLVRRLCAGLDDADRTLAIGVVLER